MSPRLPVALSIDDAPSVSGDGARFDPDRMDLVREILLRAGVPQCVAFVVGESARGHEGALERWLADGYELGNHGEHHVRVSNHSEAEFREELRACHRLLEEVGAFERGRPRFFRLPYGDRGRDAAQRAAVRLAWEELGYVAADVSVHLYDWCYEAPIARALETADDAASAGILARFHRAARGELKAAGQRRPEPDWIHVAALHFGEVAARGLEPLLAELGSDVEWRPLAEVVQQDRYRVLLRDDEVNVILADRFSGARRGPLRRAARMLRRLDWLDEERLGPVAPRWSA